MANQFTDFYSKENVDTGISHLGFPQGLDEKNVQNFLSSISPSFHRTGKWAENFTQNKHDNDTVKTIQANLFIQDPDKYANVIFAELYSQLKKKNLSEEFLEKFRTSSTQDQTTLINNAKDKLGDNYEFIQKFSSLANSIGRAKKISLSIPINKLIDEYINNETSALFRNNHMKDFDILQEVNASKQLQENNDIGKKLPIKEKIEFIEKIDTNIRSSFEELSKTYIDESQEDYHFFIENIYKNITQGFQAIKDEKIAINNAINISSKIENSTKIESFMTLKHTFLKLKENYSLLEDEGEKSKALNSMKQSLSFLIGKVDQDKFKSIQSSNFEEFNKIINSLTNDKEMRILLQKESQKDFIDNNFFNNINNILNNNYSKIVASNNNEENIRNNQSFINNREKILREDFSASLTSTLLRSEIKENKNLDDSTNLLKVCKKIDSNRDSGKLNKDDIDNFSEIVNLNDILKGKFQDQSRQAQNSIIENSIADDNYEELAKNKLNEDTVSKQSRSISVDSSLVREKMLFKIAEDLKSKFVIKKEDGMKNSTFKILHKFIAPTDLIVKFIACSETANSPMTRMQTKTSMVNDCIEKYVDSVLQKAKEDDKELIQASTGLMGLNPFLVIMLYATELRKQHAEGTRKRTLQALVQANENLKNIESASTSHDANARSILSGCDLNKDIFVTDIANKDIDKTLDSLKRENIATELTNNLINETIETMPDEYYLEQMLKYSIDKDSPVSEKKLDKDDIYNAIKNIKANGKLNKDNVFNDSISVEKNEKSNSFYNIENNSNENSIFQSRSDTSTLDNSRVISISTNDKINILNRIYLEQKNIMEKSTKVGAESKLANIYLEEYDELDKERLSIIYDLIKETAKHDSSPYVQNLYLDLVELEKDEKLDTGKALRAILNQSSKLIQSIFSIKKNKELKKAILDSSMIETRVYDIEDDKSIIAVVKNKKSLLEVLSRESTNDKPMQSLYEERLMKDITLENSQKNKRFQNLDAYANTFLTTESVSDKNSQTIRHSEINNPTRS